MMLARVDYDKATGKYMVDGKACNSHVQAFAELVRRGAAHKDAMWAVRKVRILRRRMVCEVKRP